MTEKHFLVNKFYTNLVGEARRIFQMTRSDAEAWLKSSLNPLNHQIKDHEQVLAKRLEYFKQIRDNISSVEERMKELERHLLTLQQQSQVLTGIKANLGEEVFDTPPMSRRPEAMLA
jgi:chromosome segregation ATPase